MDPTEPTDDPNLRAFDALMADVFPIRRKHPEGLTADERALSVALTELDNALCELRDLIAEMRASLAELRHARTKREDYKPWH